MPTNQIWPPGNKPSKGGAPAGLQSSEPEGDPHHIGRCIAILAGGRSGGHQAAVLNAVSPVLLLLHCVNLDTIKGFPPQFTLDCDLWSKLYAKYFRLNIEVFFSWIGS
jgi:polycomb protein EED